jgi:protoporphyrinogen IX oxidase
MLYLKALHIIFVVTWFAGLFYIVRLFIYDVEANKKDEQERLILQKQFRVMQTRLWYGITWPSAVLTISTGLYLAYMMNYYSSVWLWLKLAFVLALFIYHLICHRIFIAIKNDHNKIWTSFRLRLWNELATLFLVSIVFIVVLKDALSLLYAILGLLVVTVLLVLAINYYKKVRQKN